MFLPGGQRYGRRARIFIFGLSRMTTKLPGVAVQVESIGRVRSW